ncbi:sodium:calcium antiporter [Halomarina litorea]|uniref:sodium:calcium antiporter n=1 Tax=Halomarina litorea TaxID=2961595 RepID=UPI0020C55D50|nr:sodium:calcium antiporter [Halomarina sp. BCD28]
MQFGAPGVLVGAVVFLVGVVLVVESVETFVEAIAESAVALGVSAFFLTVLLAGTDLENAVLGLAAVLDGLPAVALGTVFGEALFIFGVAVGVAGVVTPFETRVPRPYLLLFLGTPALFFALAMDGTLTRFDGVVLTGAYLPLVVAVYVLEAGSSTRYLASEELGEGVAAGDGGREEEEGEGDGDDEDEGGFDLDLDLDDVVESERLDALRERHEGWYRLGVALLAMAGMTVGSELAVSGARGLLSAFDLSGLAFGATVMSFVASLEELALTVEPVRQGRPHLGVGNVVGSALFFVTANAGVLALVRPIDTGGAVFTVHWPFFLLTLVVVAGAFLRGRVGRPVGVLLLGTYAAYWGANYLM